MTKYVRASPSKSSQGWFEEPCEPEDLKAYKEIKAKTNIPMAGGECDFTRYARGCYIRCHVIVKPAR